MAGQWIKTKSTGVRYRQHKTRKHGVNFDRYFTIRYKIAGKEKSEGLGWATEGWTERKAAAVLAELKSNHTTGQGPTTLSEKREIKRQKEEDVYRQRQEEEHRQELENNTLFGKIFARYCEAHNKKKSLCDEIGYYRNWIEPHIGNKLLGDIILLDLERIRKAMEKADRAPRSIQYVKSIIRQVFNFASVHKLYFGAQPTIHFLKKQKIDNRRQRYLEPEEATLLLDEIRKHSEDTYRICLLSLNSGMRFSEIAGLQWQHVKNGEIIVLDPKNSETRMIFMTDRILKLFESMEEGKPNELVFPSSNGKKRGRISKVFAQAVDHLKLNEGITDRRLQVVFHTLRHSCASTLVNAGVAIPVIARILGHKTLAMTMRYSHISDNSVKNAMAVLNNEPTKKRSKVQAIN